jgi:hypothetical protein
VLVLGYADSDEETCRYIVDFPEFLIDNDMYKGQKVAGFHTVL